MYYLLFIYMMKICFSNLDHSIISEYYTKCSINTICPPDDEHRVARNMKRIIIINVLYNVISFPKYTSPTRRSFNNRPKMDFSNHKQLICQRPHKNCSPQNQQRAHNYNRSLCPGRRYRRRNETFLQTTTKIS